MKEDPRYAVGRMNPEFPAHWQFLQAEKTDADPPQWTDNAGLALTRATWDEAAELVENLNEPGAETVKISLEYRRYNPAAANAGQWLKLAEDCPAAADVLERAAKLLQEVHKIEKKTFEKVEGADFEAEDGSLHLALAEWSCVCAARDALKDIDENMRDEYHSFFIPPSAKPRDE